MAKYTKETDVLFQYSQGFRLIVPNAYKTCHTQFYSVDYPNGLAIAPSSYIVEGGKTYCPVPNQMTVKPNSIIVFAYLLEESRAITESKTVLEVWERPKPPDFVFNPTDTVTYATATKLISDMEATLGKFTNVSASATGGESAQASASIGGTGLEFTFVLPKGDKGNTGDTGATISSVTFKEYDSNGGAVYTITMTDGVTAEFTAPKGQKGDKGDIGDTGATGNGIVSVTLVSGSHAAGTTDTYRITFTNGETADFTVYNGANGEGAGDMLWEEFNARLNPANKNGQIAFESELPTSEQKSAWSAKYNKPTDGIPKTDLASSVQTSLGKADTALQEHQDISGKADATALTAHTGNADIHVTTANKTAWNAKYNKPSSGIPKSDLASAVQVSLDKADSALQEHQDISGKSNKPTFSQYTILTSGWSSGVYSFESDFPNATYDIEIELDSTATESQVEAWSNAKPTAVFGTNTMKALGDVPTVDIPVIVKKVVK